MFGLTKNRKSVEVRQTMGRLANRTFSNPARTLGDHEDLREETRHSRLLPILFTPVLVTEAELIAHCRQHIAGYKCPKSLSIWDALPLTGAGKLQKNEIRDRLNAPVNPDSVA